MEQRFNNPQSRLPNQGVTQQGRQRQALLPEYAPIDERTIADFLEFAYRFADYLLYYNDKDEAESSLDRSGEVNPGGYWKKFFSKDPSVFLATLVNAPLDERMTDRKEAIDQLNEEKNGNRQEALLGRLFSLTWDLIVEIENWRQQALSFSNLSNNDSIGILEVFDELINSRLRRDFHQLRIYASAVRREISRDAVPNLPASALGNIWQEEAGLPVLLQLSFSSPQKEDNIKLAVKKLQLISQSFLNAYQQIILASKRYLTSSLENQGDHPPSVGLFLTFIHLYGYLQQDLNKLTGKHLDLFYREILQQKPLPPQPDEVHLYFEMADHIESFYLEKGTLLTAGNQGGEDEVLYEVLEDVTLNKAKIEEVKTLYVSKNSKVGTGSTYRLVSGIFIADKANSKDGKGAPMAPDETWATFGEDQVLKPVEDLNMAPANIGLGIASPVLMLKEGERNVQVRMVLDVDSSITFRTLLTDIARQKKISEENAFALMFAENLKLTASGEKSWIPLDNYHTQVVLGPINWEIHLSFQLEVGDPSIVPWHPGLPGDAFPADWPVLKVLLDPNANPYGYSFWQDLQLEQILIHAEVQNIRQIDLYSDIGKLDNSQPFQPFGPLPVQGSYLMLGNVELFKKKLTQLRINLEWMNLPRKKGGLTEHYKAYDLGITNLSFRVAASVLSRNEFHPLNKEQRPEHRLFNSFREPPEKSVAYNPELALGLERPVVRTPSPEELEKEGAPVSPLSSLEMDLEALDFRPDPNLESTNTYDRNSSSGFFKLELVAPEVAFGHHEYPSIFTQVVTMNAITSGQRQLLPFRTIKAREVPEQPYTPVLKNLSIDYSAKAQIDFQKGKNTQGERGEIRYYHLHPFGVRTILDDEGILTRHLLPQYHEDGYLYLGIRDLTPPEVLSLYFQMEDNPSRQVFESPPEITWSYLSKRQWLDFNTESLLSDGTNGFTTSGIIQVEIPRDIMWDATMMPSHLFWIRISVKGDPERLSRTYLLKPQGIKARWVNDGRPEHLEQPLPALAIEKLLVSVPEVSELIQPYPSFGGKPEEQQTHFYTRVSERLRHKHRVVTAWDVERMILEEFPNIHQVKCLTHALYPDFVEQGKVTVIVVPDLVGWDPKLDPMVSFNLRQQIQDFLECYASPFGEFLVRNPAYDRLKINAKVTFRKGRNTGGFLQKLTHDLENFICPWRQDPSQPLNLGGSLSKDAVLRFMQELDYLEFVTAFSLVSIITHEGKQVEALGEYSLYDPASDESRSPVILPSSPWSVIVPFERHPITFTFRQTYTEPDPVGISNMIIGSDFIVTGKEKEDQGHAGEDLYFLTLEL